MEQLFGFDAKKVAAYQTFSVMNKTVNILTHLQEVLYGVVPLKRADELSIQISEFRDRLETMADEVLRENNVGLEEALLLDIQLGKAGLI